jgi:hypothetical protein
MKENLKITKIVVMDFDKTLCLTPDKETGIIQYKEKTGKDYPHQGWYGKPESLDTDIFDIPLIKEVKDAYDKLILEPHTLMVLLTGRITKCKDAVINILHKHNLEFDEAYFNNTNDTLSFKMKKLTEIVQQYPHCQEIEIFEDRTAHIPSFEEWGVNLQEYDPNYKFTLHHIQNQEALI